MKIPRRIGIAAGVLCACLVTACSKDDDMKTRMQLLTTGSWHVSAYQVNPAVDWDGDGTNESDVYPVMDECIKDDFTTFFADSTGELNEGPTKCNITDQQVIPLAWSFFNSETKLRVQTEEYSIETLTEISLVIKQVVYFQADSVIHTVSFVH